MSSELRRQLREALGPEIKGLQRAVALEIADDARYDDAWAFDAARGRRSKVRLSDLVRWTGAKNERVVRDALRSLSLAGWEFRLPIGKGVDGRPLYAIPGLAMQYRVPEFVGPTVVGASSEGPAVAVPSGSEGPVVTAEGPAVAAQGPVTTAQGPAVAVPPSPVLLLASPKESPSPSSPVVTPATVDAEVEDGGGGGDFLSGDTSTAETLAASLDYRGRAPRKTQHQQLITRLVAALSAGWTEQDLRTYLDLGGAAIRDAAAVYVSRLAEDELPDAERFRAVRGQALAGGGMLPGDQNVAGWMALAGKGDSWPAPKRGYQRADPNDVWARYAEAEKNGTRPPGSDKVPPCGHIDCDPITRHREKRGDDDLPYSEKCEACHPLLRL